MDQEIVIPAFVTVHDFDLSSDERAIWGGLGCDPETYPCVDGLSARDSALIHIVRLLSERGDAVGARRYAATISDATMRWVQLGLLPPVDA